MAIIEIENLGKSFGTHILFDQFNLQIEAGEMVCIWGKSGCGKTTLLNIIGLLDSYDVGTLKIADVTNPKHNGKESLLLRRNILGYIFQNFALVDNETVDKNLDLAMMYNKEIENKEEAKKEILKKMDIERTQYQKIYELSGGEQQRVSIARIFLKPCEIILADEPTGSLDNINKLLVMDYLKELNQLGKTVIIVTHDPEIAKGCQRVVEL